MVHFQETICGYLRKKRYSGRMNYVSVSVRVLLIALVIGLLPVAVSAHSKTATTTGELPRGAAQVPLKASELASFVLSIAALVTAGIALSRTHKPHRSPHQ